MLVRVLVLGDVMGKPGREAIKRVVPRWRAEQRADFIIVNGENCAGGKGVSTDTIREILEAGVDVVTTGNHVWDNRDVFNFIDHEPRMIRPANYPSYEAIPGKGYLIADCPALALRVGVVNLLGRVFMEPVECPFHTADRLLEEIRRETPIIFVDFHAEATSEKMAFGWHLDGRVSCVYGTHTHVPTADERILPRGTAYITDIGMTGALDSVIGVKPEQVIQRFRTNMPIRWEVAEKNVAVCGILVTVDAETGKAVAIERIREKP